ncbi:MAG TPA: acetyl-CoA carboxylase biotin carboxyl carrier protein subunit, partial [Sphingobacteriaceae bacterium]|nr:acetyl-CoA carboxylase biotin carboxyl carrier protein subunit [Sphingobacteriaceae bacterium]
MLNIEINNAHAYKVVSDHTSTFINDEITEFDLQPAGKNRVHIIRNHKSYLAELLSFNPEEKTGALRINNNTYRFTARDQYDELLKKLGIDTLHVKSISELKAPMPGMVLKIIVQEGQEVKKGDNLLILEAMKMENIIKSPADLTILSLKIKSGDKVEKNQILIMF